MAKFRYKGRDQSGDLVSGQLDGRTADTVAEQLQQQGITPLVIRQAGGSGAKTATSSARPARSASSGESRGAWGINWQKLFQRELPLNELVMFVRQMYSLTKAGIPMLRAVQGLGENASHKVLQETLTDIGEQLERGRSLSAAMAEHPHCFPRVVIAVVHVGENTGRLEESFEQLARFLESEQETRKQIKSATRYPTFVLITLAIAIVALNIFVIPTFVSMFESFNVDLPLVTRILIGTSDVFVNYWPLLAVAVAGCIAGLKYWLKQPQARRTWDRWKLRLPAVGSIIERSLLARFCRSFSVMLNAGVPLTQAISLTGDAMDNHYMSERVYEMRRGVERGEALVRVARNSELFTPLVLQMVAVGEETGSLDDLLDEAAEYYEREVDYDLKNVMAKIEPLLVAFVAVIVLILAMGIFLPMWGMMDAYGGGM